MSKFSLDDYVDVAERIAQFSAKYPEGSLQSELTRHEDGWLCRGYAFRSADDPRPGIGHAFEPVPGKTPYTRDSEAQNAETAAWGRAIVALGFETKKIASKQEVKARGAGERKPVAGTDSRPAPRNKSDLSKSGSGNPVSDDAPSPKLLEQIDQAVDEYASVLGVDRGKVIEKIGSTPMTEQWRTSQFSAELALKRLQTQMKQVAA